MDCVRPRIVKVRYKDPTVIMLKKKEIDYIEVPCGMCIACRIAKSREWTVRLMMEKTQWQDSGFLTLTYDNDHVPVTPCGHLTLWPKDLQDFWKRLRIQLHRKKMMEDEQYYQDYETHRRMLIEDPDYDGSPPPLLRYFSCGEYGDTTHRPHYHAALFGLGPKDYDFIRSVWKRGNVVIEPLNEERSRYVASYVEKKIYIDPTKYWDLYGCCVRPFQRVSQGLGLGYYEKNKDEYWINLRPTINGVSYSTPRYFSTKDEELKRALSIIGDRQQKIALNNAFKSQDEGYGIYETRKQREANLKARSRMKKGSL